MKRKADVQGGPGAAASEDWYGTSWCCSCQYSNVGTDRCYFCGARAPHHVFAQAAGLQAASPGPAPSES